MSQATGSVEYVLLLLEQGVLDQNRFAFRTANDFGFVPIGTHRLYESIRFVVEVFVARTFTSGFRRRKNVGLEHSVDIPFLLIDEGPILSAPLFPVPIVVAEFVDFFHVPSRIEQR